MEAIPARRWDRYRRLLASRPWQFLLQGALISSAVAFGSTMAASLFLANVGADQIPVYYILFALISIPLTVAFSGFIDRWPRRRSLTILLMLYMAGTALVAGLAGDGRAAYYALYLTVSVCELMIYSVFYILFSDYFTATEGKRYAGHLTIALGVGAAIGSLMVSGLAELVGPRRVFLALPLLVGLAMLHLAWLTRREEPLDEVESAAEEGLVESLKALPQVSRRYPIVLLMAVSVFLNIVGQCIMEFEAFSIYEAAFPDEAELASFLGRMTAAVDVIGILIVFYVSNPLMQRLGVARINLAAPMVNLASFVTLSTSSSLPAGILAHLNYYPLEHSLNVPAFALTYNAVPRRFVGRVRVSNDGIVYPLALAATGLGLLLVGQFLSLAEVSLIGAAAALLYLAAQWGIGRRYAHGLVDMLRKGTIDLDQVESGFKLPAEQRDEILAMLGSDDPDLVSLGIELAARCDIALAPADLERTLPRLAPEVARSALGIVLRNHPEAADLQLRLLLGASLGPLRALALETLIAAHHAIEPALLEGLRRDPDETVRALAAVSRILHDAAREPALIEELSALASREAALAVLRVLRAYVSTDQTPILEALGAHASASVRAEALAVAARAALPGDARLTGWARRALADRDATVRAAAATLLVRAGQEHSLTELGHSLFGDQQAEVRHATALALGHRGGRGLTALAVQLRRGDHDLVGEVMDGIGLAGPEIADGILYAYLSESVFPTVERNLGILRQLPAQRPGWRALEIAVADSNDRAVHSVLHALGVLGYKRVLGLVRTAMRTGDSRTRANAVETLSSLAHRRYVLPLLPLLERLDAPARLPPPWSAGEARGLLARLMAEQDDFISAAAMTVWRAEFGALPATAPRHSSPLLAATRRAAEAGGGNGSYDEDLPMNRLAFLKSVPLFSSLTLEHLMAVDAAMTREPYLRGEEIIREGEVGDKLYIVFRGEVAIRKRLPDGEERELARLTSGQLFGEMALFDDERRSATALAMSDAELLGLDREHFHSLAYQRPDIPIQVCKVLVARLRTAIS